ncbi:MAG: hypothetical protein ACK55Z_27045, partial [bacterium]
RSRRFRLLRGERNRVPLAVYKLVYRRCNQMAKSAKKEVAVKESPIQSHLKGEATNKRVAGATRKAKQIGDAINARLKQLQSSALALVNAFNAEDTAGDAVSAARKVFYA